jgi:hypothetical protein
MTWGEEKTKWRQSDEAVKARLFLGQALLSSFRPPVKTASRRTNLLSESGHGLEDMDAIRRNLHALAADLVDSGDQGTVIGLHKDHSVSASKRPRSRHLYDVFLLSSALGRRND